MKNNFKPAYREESFGYIVSTPDGWVDVYDKACLPLLQQRRFDELQPYRLGDVSDLISLRSAGGSPRQRVKLPREVLDATCPLKSPITVQIETTLHCNLHCKHCFNHSGKARNDELTLDELKRHLDELRELEVMSVIFTGGEITLRPDFVDIIQHTRDIGLGYFVQTHGGFLTPQLLDRVPEQTYFIISWDGIRSHRKVHGGAMDTQGMVSLFRMLKQRKFPFSAQYVARRENLEELPDTYRWCQENKVDFTAIDIYPTGRAMKWKDIFPTRDQIPLFEGLARAKFDYELAKEDWELDEEWNGAENPYHFTFIFRLEQIFERSFAGVFYAYVTSDGRVYPDNFHGGDDHLCAGSIRDRSFTDLWRNSFVDARELMLWRNWPECVTCPLSKGYCDYRLPVFSYNLHKKYNVCGATDVYKEVAMLRNQLRLAEPEVFGTDAARSWDTW